MKKGNKKINLCFASILGNYSINTATADVEKKYELFFSKIYANYNFKCSLYFTAELMTFLQKKTQSAHIVINEMLSRKQIELLGGCYFSPLFSMLPPSDITGQLEMLTVALRKNFNQRPKGVFLPHSAWKPAVILPIKKTTGFEYCLLDNRCFKKSGLSQYEPVCMEESGKIITVVPYTTLNNIHNMSPQDFLKYIEKQASSNINSVVVLVIPFEDIIEILTEQNGNSWFAEFMNLVNEKEELIKISTIGNTVNSTNIYNKGFIEANIIKDDEPSNSSINQMLIENPYAYSMYNKMMYVHTLANQIRGDKPRKKSTLEILWKAESSNFFIEGGFNPHENKHLRNKFYHQILLAEKQTKTPGVFTDSLIQFDFNLDGIDEYLSQRKDINMYLTIFGGKIFECDFFPAYKNYSDIPFENTGIFIDNLVTDADLIKLGNGDSVEQVFAESQYQVVKCNRKYCTLQLKVKSKFKNQDISLKKKYDFQDDGAQVQYILKNNSEKTLTAYFVSEIDISLTECRKKIPAISVYADDKKHELKITSEKFNNISWLQIDDSDGKTQFTIEANEVPNLLLLPIKNTNEELLGIRAYFYWKVNVAPSFETEKMLFFKIAKIK